MITPNTTATYRRKRNASRSDRSGFSTTRQLMCSDGRMKRTLLIVAAAVAATALIPATASARTKYCSSSGDVCYRVIKGSPYKLQITTAAKYFSRYRLCIRSNSGRECHRFRMRRAAGGTYASTIVLENHFSYLGRGLYKATWYAGGNRLGPSLTF